MSAINGSRVLTEDVARLRYMASRIREFADSEENQARIAKWYAHDECAGGPPLLLTEMDGGLQMILPEFAPECREPWAQGLEYHLQSLLAHVETIGDDFPIDPYISVGWSISTSGFGVEERVTQPDVSGSRGAYHIDGAITDLRAEFGRLQPRAFAVDREATLAHRTLLEEVFDGILGVRMHGNPWWTLGFTWTVIRLIGLENLMLYMYDDPESLHKLMAFLRDDEMAFLDWMEAEGLLSLNNEGDYVGSGSRGYTRSLPSSEWKPESHLSTRDLWTLIESQETVGVGPDLYEEFIFPYEDSVAKRFGGVYYGCCEPVHTRWSVLKDMANLRRVSVSPWCDEEFMAEALGSRYVYSRKPNPSLISTRSFDEDAIRRDIRNTLDITRKHGCTVEIVMKDVHTLNGEPDRMARWVRIARDEIARVWG